MIRLDFWVDLMGDLKFVVLGWIMMFDFMLYLLLYEG